MTGTYIYIYIEREREKEKERQRQREIETETERDRETYFIVKSAKLKSNAHLKNLINQKRFDELTGYVKYY